MKLVPLEGSYRFGSLTNGGQSTFNLDINNRLFLSYFGVFTRPGPKAAVGVYSGNPTL